MINLNTLIFGFRRQLETTNISFRCVTSVTKKELYFDTKMYISNEVVKL